METEENASLLDDLAAAWDEHEAEEAEIIEDPVEAPLEEPVEEVAEVSEEAPEEVTEEPIAASETEDKAPVGLPPAAREVWKDTPQAMKEAIAKREKDYAAGIQQYAEDAKRAKAMDRTLAPYSQLFAMNGGPQNVMPGLLQTASILQMGSPQQKAQTLANLVKQFDVPIDHLDSALVGETIEANPNDQIQRAIQQAMAPYQQYMMSQQRAQQGQIQSDLQNFASDPANEFYNDVRNEMADILEVYAKQGREITLKDAYNRACMMRDDIRALIEARSNRQASASRRAAASSVSGSPGAPPGPKEPDSLREAIELAWSEASR